jgi:cytochrome P450
MIIINSTQAAIEMLDRKGSIYSDRPVVQMGGELVGWKSLLGLTPYGDRFRNLRQLAHKLLGSNATMSQFLPTVEQETHRFLQRLLQTPTEFEAHVRKCVLTILAP